MTVHSGFQIGYDVTQRGKTPAIIGVFVFLLDAVFLNGGCGVFRILNIYSQKGTSFRSFFYCARGAPWPVQRKNKNAAAFKEMLFATLH